MEVNILSTKTHNYLTGLTQARRAEPERARPLLEQSFPCSRTQHESVHMTLNTGQNYCFFVFFLGSYCGIPSVLCFSCFILKGRYFPY